MNPRILIATPTDGDPRTAHVSYGYHETVRNLERSGCVKLPGTIAFSDDLARGRSRLVHVALQRDGWDAILWLDDDVVIPDVSIIGRMANSGHDVIGAPYPRKRIPAQFPYKPLLRDVERGALTVVNDVAEVELLAIGCMLTSRECLEMMVREYSDALWFLDGGHDGKPISKVVGIFHPLFVAERPDHRELYSEDYSFCARWRALGGRVHMYVGEGAPVAHVGGHVFCGAREDIGRAR